MQNCRGARSKLMGVIPAYNCSNCLTQQGGGQAVSPANRPRQLWALAGVPRISRCTSDTYSITEEALLSLAAAVASLRYSIDRAKSNSACDTRASSLKV